jgi:isopenicillin-N epimerase
MQNHPFPEPHAARVRARWTLDPAVTFLNHGSFGACPRPVLEAQARLREQLEREPVRFFVRELESMLDAARAEVAAFVGADPEDLAFVPNATAGVNTVLRSLDLRAGDELCVTDQEYNACRNALEAVAARAGARVVVAAVPFPIASPDQVVEAVLACVGPRTRLALLDHVTSQTGLIFPIERLVAEVQGRGVDVLVDGAHAPGMVPLDLRALGAAYYTGNCHKWICAPKGAAILHVRRDRQAGVRPLAVSHGASSRRADRSRFQVEFDWTGTCDPTAFLCVPEAIRFMGGLLPGGWPALMDHNRRTALAGRALLCEALGCERPSPDAMIGALASLPLPDGDRAPAPSPLYMDPLQDALLERHGVEVPVIPWPAPPRRLLRISAQIYNEPGDYQRLARALGEILPAERAVGAPAPLPVG